MKRIELEFTGLKCDNINCDYEEPEINFVDYKQYLNKPCPKCGDSLLTEEDLEEATKGLEEINDLENTHFPKE